MSVSSVCAFWTEPLMADLALDENVKEVIVRLLAVSAGYELAQHSLAVVLVQQ